MNCFVCSKKKEDFEVWTNKVVIAATFDSIFQDHDVIRNMSNQSVLCHHCVKKITDEVDAKR